MLKLVQHGPHCTGTSPRHIQTCSTWTSLYRALSPDTFKLVQHGPHCTGPSPQMHSNLYNMDLIVQGPLPRHIQTCTTWTSLYRALCPRHIQTCSTWTSLYRALSPDTFKLVQHGPHCTGTSPHTHSNLYNMDLTIQCPLPRHIQTCSTWTSLYRDLSQDTFKLVQHGPHCTGPSPQTHSNLYNMDLTVQGPLPDTFKLDQHGPHCTGTSPHTHSNLYNMDLTIQGPLPRHIQTCSTWTSLYRALSPDTFKLVQHGPHCTGPSPHTHSNLYNMDLTVQDPPPDTFKLVQHGPHCKGTSPIHIQTCTTWTSLYRTLSPDTFKLVQHGPHCTGPSPQTHSNLFNMDLTIQGPLPRHIQTCSTWTSLYRALPSPRLVELRPHCTGTPPPC